MLGKNIFGASEVEQNKWSKVNRLYSYAYTNLRIVVKDNTYSYLNFKQ